jgi:ABC-type ATPase with predicted acetyltransferase domain
MQITLHHTLDPAAATPSENVRALAGMFGLGLEPTPPLELIPPTALTLRPHQIIFITGPSGSGKSTLLRLIAQHTSPLIPKPNAERSEASDIVAKPLIDTFPTLTLDDTLRLLGRVGLGDAFVLLRSVPQLSDGQRARYRLAQTIAATEAHLAQRPDAPRDRDEPRAVVPADEFGATLDRVTAKAVARQVRRWVDRTPVCLVAATTHDDLLDALSPDVLIHKPLGAGVEVIERSSAARGLARSPRASCPR